jgi:hypothetical protein
MTASVPAKGRADENKGDLRTPTDLLFFMNAIDKSISSLFATAWEDENK